MVNVGNDKNVKNERIYEVHISLSLSFSASNCHPVFSTSCDVIGWLNGRASVFGTEGYGFESRVGLTYLFNFSQSRPFFSTNSMITTADFLALLRNLHC